MFTFVGMYKGIAILYLVCFLLYIVYSREPDFIDGEKSVATIHWFADSLHKDKIPQAVYSVCNKQYAVDARYVFRSLPEGKPVTVIYNPSHPEKAALYAFWGYMLTWGELMGSVVLLIALFQVAVAVTKNPTPESLVEQLSYQKERKTKYD
jgi:hypothetical protein